MIKYKVIANYPFNKHFCVGAILVLNTLSNGEVWYNYNKGDIHQSFEEGFFKSYPAIFEKIK